MFKKGEGIRISWRLPILSIARGRIIDYEYFHEFDAEIEKAFSGTYAELINTKNIKTCIIAMPLSMAKEIKVK
jgi:hypothetical protein